MRFASSPRTILSGLVCSRAYLRTSLFGFDIAPVIYKMIVLNCHIFRSIHENGDFIPLEYVVNNRIPATGLRGVTAAEQPDPRGQARRDFIMDECVLLAMLDRNAIMSRVLDVIVNNRGIAREAQPESIVAMASHIAVELVPRREDGFEGVMERVASIVERNVVGIT